MLSYANGLCTEPLLSGKTVRSRPAAPARLSGCLAEALVAVAGGVPRCTPSRRPSTGSTRMSPASSTAGSADERGALGAGGLAPVRGASSGDPAGQRQSRLPALGARVPRPVRVPMMRLAWCRGSSSLAR